MGARARRAASAAERAAALWRYGPAEQPALAHKDVPAACLAGAESRCSVSICFQKALTPENMLSQRGVPPSLMTLFPCIHKGLPQPADPVWSGLTCWLACTDAARTQLGAAGQAPQSSRCWSARRRTRRRPAAAPPGDPVQHAWKAYRRPCSPGCSPGSSARACTVPRAALAARCEAPLGLPPCACCEEPGPGQGQPRGMLRYQRARALRERPPLLPGQRGGGPGQHCRPGYRPGVLPPGEGTGAAAPLPQQQRHGRRSRLPRRCAWGERRVQLCGQGLRLRLPAPGAGRAAAARAPCRSCRSGCARAWPACPRCRRVRAPRTSSVFSFIFRLASVPALPGARPVHT